jgi:hypothetical protein
MVTRGSEFCFELRHTLRATSDLLVSFGVGLCAGYFADEKLPDSIAAEFCGTVGTAYVASGVHAATGMSDTLARLISSIPFNYTFASNTLAGAGMWAGIYMGRLTNRISQV